MTHLVPVLRPVLGSPFRRAGLYRAAGEIPSWHIAPVRTGTVTDLITGSQIITFTNSSPAWGFNSSGVLVQPTANVPFIEYDPATGSALGWRIWDAVTNLLLRSAEIDNTSLWLRNGSPTITADALVSPDGNTNAELITATAAFSGPLQFISQTTGTTYTASAFIKDGGGANKTITIGMGPQVFGSGSDRTATFNVSTGVLSGIDPVYTSTFVSQPVNGWRRVALTYTTSATASSALQFYGTASNVLFGLYGAQLNTGPLAPYVPTGALAASSTADVASITGAAFAGIWNQAAGTIYASVIMAQPTKSGNQFIIRASDNGYNNTVNLNVQSGFPSISTSAGGVFDGTATSAQSLTTAAANFAGACAANDLALAHANATVTDSTATMPSNLTRIDFGADHNGLNRATGVYIREAAIFKSRRPNTNLQSIIAS